MLLNLSDPMASGQSHAGVMRRVRTFMAAMLAIFAVIFMTGISTAFFAESADASYPTGPAKRNYRYYYGNPDQGECFHNFFMSSKGNSYTDWADSVGVITLTYEDDYWYTPDRSDYTIAKIQQPNNPDNIFTRANGSEYDFLLGLGYRVCWDDFVYSFASTDPGFDQRAGIPVYRIYSNTFGEHHYICNPHELWACITEPEGSLYVGQNWSMEGTDPVMYACIPYHVKYVQDGHVLYNDDNQLRGVPYTVRYDQPSKTGYTFKNWKSSLDGAIKNNGDTFSTSEQWTLVDAPDMHFDDPGHTYYSYAGDYYFTVLDRTVHPRTVFMEAQFTPNSYNVTYKPNGGDGPDRSQTVTYDHSWTTYADSTFTRTGYTFAGWNTKADGSGTSYSANSTATWKSTDNMVLYAQWAPIKYSVIYKNNGGTGKDVVQQCTYGYSYNYYGNDTTKFSRDDWQFRTWSLSSGEHRKGSDDWTNITPGSSFANLADTNGSSVIVYAVWDPFVTFVVDDEPAYLDKDGRGGSKVCVSYGHAVPDSVWKDKTNKAARTDTRGVAGLSAWSSDNTYGKADAGPAVDKNAEIVAPTTFYIRNSVEFWYESTEDSSIQSHDYTFFVDQDMTQALDQDNWTNLYYPNKLDKAVIWYGNSVKLIDGESVWTMDINPRQLHQGDIFTTKTSSAKGLAPGSSSGEIKKNMAFYVHWPWAVYDGVNSAW